MQVPANMTFQTTEIMTISETLGKSVNLPDTSYCWSVSDACSLHADGTIHLAIIIVITCYWRQKTEARWEVEKCIKIACL